jgi:hypothetical protein
MRTSAKEYIQSLVAEILETQDPIKVQVIGAKLQSAIRELSDELRLKAAGSDDNWQGEPSL